MSIRIKNVTDTSRENRIYKILSAYFTIMISTQVFVDVFEVPCDIRIIAIVTFLQVLTISIGIANQKITRYVLFAVFLILLVFVYVNRFELRNAVLELVNILINNIDRYFDKNINTFVVESENRKVAITKLIAVLNLEMALVVVTLMWFNIKTIALILVSSITFFMGLLVGKMPGRSCMLEYVFLMLTYLAIYAAGGKVRANIAARKKQEKIFLCIMLLSFVSSQTAIRVVSPVGYNREQTIQKTRDYISEKLYDYSHMSLFDFLSGKRIAKGGIGGGTLGNIDELFLDDESMFEVTVPSDTGGFYIKGFVGINYKDNSWQGLNSEQKEFLEEYEDTAIDDSLMSKGFCSIISGIINGDASGYLRQYESKAFDTITFDITGASRDYFYYPYFADLTEYISYMDISVESIMPMTARFNFINYKSDKIYSDDDYTVNIYALPTNDEDKISKELYVNNGYDYISDEVMELFAKEFELSKKKYTMSLEEKIDYVKNTLAKRCKYTLKPGRLKKGEDFLTEFLIDDKKGYCSYYATAATIMLRELGVPARYVEGYVVTQKDYKDNLLSKENIEQMVIFDDEWKNVQYSTLDIKGTNAHAWTEIYQPFIGWVPVEVTPGYESDIEIGKSVNNNETTKQTQSTTTTTTTANKTTTSSRTTKKNITNKANEVDSANVIYIMCVCVVLAIVGALTVIITIKVKNKRIGLINQKNNRLSMIHMSALLDAICKKSSCRIDNDMTTEAMAEKISTHFDVDYTLCENSIRAIDKAKFSSEATDVLDSERKEVFELLTCIVDNRRKTCGIREKLFYMLNFENTGKNNLLNKLK